MRDLGVCAVPDIVIVFCYRWLWVLCSILRFSKTFGTEFEELKWDTTSLVKGTPLETIEGQTQQELLYKNLENYVVTRGSEVALGVDQARAMLEVVAEAAKAQAATQSMLALQDEDTTDAVRRPKVQRTDRNGFEVVINPIENRRRPERQDTATDGVVVWIGADAVDANERRFRDWRISKEGRLQESGGENGRQDGRRIQERTTRKTAGAKWDSAGIQKTKIMQDSWFKRSWLARRTRSKIWTWAVAVLSAVRHWSGTGVWYFCSATATLFTVEWNFHSKQSGIQRLGRRLFKQEPSGNYGWRNNDNLEWSRESGAATGPQIDILGPNQEGTRNTAKENYGKHVVQAWSELDSDGRSAQSDERRIG